MMQTPFQCIPSHGSYFECYSYANISDEDAITFTKRILTEHKVATIPVSVFNADGRDLKHIRFCFAKEPQTLTLATEILCQLSVLR